MGMNVGVFLLFAVLLTPEPTPIVFANAMSTRPVITAPSNQYEKKPIIGIAERVAVPSVAIDQMIRPGSYDMATNAWTLDSESAFHATTTVPVNNSNGTTLIYGHAERAIFGRLLEVQPGAEAMVHTLDGHLFIYSYESSRQVAPTDTSQLTATGKPKLLLQTCSGPFDAYRTLVTFSLKEVIYDA